MAAPRQPLARGFFSAADYQPGVLSDESRWLSAAAYLNPVFAHHVISEVVEDERRSVAQSRTLDLIPVVVHSFRARRLAMLRDAVLFGLVIVGLYVATVPTVAWLVIGLLVLNGRPINPQRTNLATRLAIGGTLVLALAWGLAELGTLLWSLGSGPTDWSPTDAITAGAVLLPLGLAGLTWLTLFGFHQHTYSIIVNELAAGARPPAAPPGQDRILDRLVFVGQAQRGNVTIQDTRPFLGAGHVSHSWSVAIRLTREGSDETVLLDPVEAHRRIRAAIERLRSEDLPEGARISSVRMLDHVVADGVRRPGGDHERDPLLHESGLPYTLASPSAIDAVVRCPQGGLRYYQRILIPSVTGKQATWGGHVVVPEQQMGIDVSAFVHVAIEGGLLYVEFVATVLPAVWAGYRVGDTLRPDHYRAKAAWHALLGMPANSAAAPWRFGYNVWRSATTAWRMSRAAAVSEQFRTYDYGARLSVRELAAEPAVRKHLQLLDQEKYIKLLDRAVSQALSDFLAAHGVDTSEFTERMNFVQNYYAPVHQNSGGQQSYGRNATVTQTAGTPR